MAQRKPYKRKLRNMLVDKKFQLKYTLFVMVICVAIFGVLGWLYYNEMKAATELMDINNNFKGAVADVPDKAEKPASEEEAFLKSLEGAAGDPEGNTSYVAESLKKLDEDIKPELSTRDNRAVFILLGAVALLVLILALGGIYVTHKVVGPLYALTLFMKAAQAGEWKRIRPFRDGDEFVDLSREVGKLATSIKSKHESELTILRDIQQEMGERLPAEASEKLSSLIADKEEYISH